ncbi:MAG: NFACT RNA binding domain-containing protein [Calditrichaceae bacterium]
MQPAYNIKQPQFQLFDKVQNQVICDLFIHLFDKQVAIELEKYKIITFFYGSQPNIFITDQKDSVIDSFKTGDMPELTRPQNGIDFRSVNRGTFDFDHSESLKIFLKNKFAALNNTIIDEIVYRFEQNNVEIKKKLKLKYVLESIKNEIDKAKTYIYRQGNSVKKISLFILTYLESNNDITLQEFDSVNAAWQRFISEKADQAEYDKLYRECVSAVKKKMEYLNRSLKHAAELEDLKERKRAAELKGNLLLTFKHQINIEKNEVILKNIFSDNLENMRIKVNPNKSVSENAQIYFNKYKDIDKKLLAEDVKTNTLSHEISILSDINNKLNAVSSLSELKRLYKKLIDLNLLSMTTSSSNKSDKQQIAFKHFVLEDNWHVYIGKSGENNDELTFNYAKKQDYWFHAQGVPGSHVILKVKQKDQVPPHQILEQVAGIAAANSKSKHSATVPVIYTQVRYVSRIRNAPKGTVNTRNEKTIFVEPFNI